MGILRLVGRQSVTLLEVDDLAAEFADRRRDLLGVEELAKVVVSEQARLVQVLARAELQVQTTVRPQRLPGEPDNVLASLRGQRVHQEPGVDDFCRTCGSDTCGSFGDRGAVGQVQLLERGLDRRVSRAVAGAAYGGAGPVEAVQTVASSR